MNLDKYPVRSGDTVVVLGAHFGDEVIHYAKKVGNRGRVIAVEPIQENYDILKLRVMKRGLWWVNMIHGAIWDSDGERNIHVGTNSTNAGFIKEWNEGDEKVKTFSWGTLTKDLGKITLVNVDIEGAEIEWLNGMTANMPRYIILEHHKQFGVNLEELERQLVRKHYSFEKINQYYYGVKLNDVP